MECLLCCCDADAERAKQALETDRYATRAVLFHFVAVVGVAVCARCLSGVARVLFGFDRSKRNEGRKDLEGRTVAIACDPFCTVRPSPRSKFERFEQLCH